MPRLPPGFPPPVEQERLTGGDVDEVWRLRLEDGHTVVLKESRTEAGLEAEGLAALRSAGAPTPEVLAVDGRTLVLAYVTGPGDLRELGRAVATAHRATATSFGWHRDNVLGPLTQPNRRSSSWPEFYAQQRLAPHLEVLPPPLARRLRDAVERDALASLLDHAPVPSLVHGDLWRGNIVGDRWLIDPAVHHADRELDLAMLALFGGIPQGFLEGYEEVWPLDDGWEQRLPALQLYHLLVHVRLFGPGYLPAVTSRLDRLGW